MSAGIVRFLGRAATWQPFESVSSSGIATRRRGTPKNTVSRLSRPWSASLTRMASILPTVSTPNACYRSGFLGQIDFFVLSMPNAWLALYFASSAPGARPLMRRRSTQKTSEPSKASLREIPEIDLSKVRVLGRGRHVERARRSFDTVLVERRVLDTLGGPDAVVNILQTLAASVSAGRKKRSAA